MAWHNSAAQKEVDAGRMKTRGIAVRLEDGRGGEAASVGGLFKAARPTSRIHGYRIAVL
jgi:hypothetical protein